MTNATWLFIFSHHDPVCCICHLDRNRSIKTLLYSNPLTASADFFFLLFVSHKWEMIDGSALPPPCSQCVKMDRWGRRRAQDFPTIVSNLPTAPPSLPPTSSFFSPPDRKGSLGTHFAANLTICLLARSPTATNACTLNCCWRSTKKHCLPEEWKEKQTVLATRRCFLSAGAFKAPPLLFEAERSSAEPRLLVSLSCSRSSAGGLSKSVKHLWSQLSLWREWCGGRGDCYLANTHSHTPQKCANISRIKPWAVDSQTTQVRYFDDGLGEQGGGGGWDCSNAKIPPTDAAHSEANQDVVLLTRTSSRRASRSQTRVEGK